jgi:hypothetical protein
MTLTETTELIAVMQIHWPNHPWHDKADQAYHRGLDDLSYADVNAAVTLAIRTCKFAPTVAELRDLVGANAESDIDAEAAWADVKEQIRVAGIYQTPRFADPATDQAVRAMGWPGLCTMLISQEMTHRKHFMDIFRSMKRRQNQQAVREAASGITPIGGKSTKQIAS